MKKPILLYTVFAKPADYPHDYVCRITRVTGDEIRPDPDLFCKSPSLDHVRFRLEKLGLVNVGRMKDDAPSLLEVWM